jgi:hypothetical protein
MTKKGKGFKRKARKVSLLVLTPALAPTLISALEQKDRFSSDPMGAASETLLSMGVRYTGYNARDGRFYPNYVWPTWAGILLGALGHKAMNKLGVNRALSGVPYVNM